jgi:membrane-associated phospholipid phosphatase
MSHLPFYQEQLDFIVHLATNRPEWLNPFFRFLNYFDSPYFYFVLIPTIWLGFSYRWGIRIFYWFTLNNLLINYAKNTIGWHRPSTDFASLGLFHPKSFGFPSGGAQMSMLLGGLLIYHWRTPLAWLIGVTYILLISFSRLYLGVHYPIDILGGWVFGACMIALFIYLKDPVEKWLIKKGLNFSLLLTLLIPLAILIAFPVPTMFYSMGSVMGIGVGTYFSLRNKLFLAKPEHYLEAIGRSFTGIFLLFLFVWLFPGKDTFIKSFSASLFMSLCASPICHWLKKNEVRTSDAKKH